MAANGRFITANDYLKFAINEQKRMQREAILREQLLDEGWKDTLKNGFSGGVKGALAGVAGSALAGQPWYLGALLGGAAGAYRGYKNNGNLFSGSNNNQQYQNIDDNTLAQLERMVSEQMEKIEKIDNYLQKLGV